MYLNSKDSTKSSNRALTLLGKNVPRNASQPDAPTQTNHVRSSAKFRSCSKAQHDRWMIKRRFIDIRALQSDFLYKLGLTSLVLVHLCGKLCRIALHISLSPSLILCRSLHSHPLQGPACNPSHCHARCLEPSSASFPAWQVAVSLTVAIMLERQT